MKKSLTLHIGLMLVNHEFTVNTESDIPVEGVTNNVCKPRTHCSSLSKQGEILSCLCSVDWLTNVRKPRLHYKHKKTKEKSLP